MGPEHRAPSFWHVVRAIAIREIGIASRRKFVRLLFLGSLGPPLIFGIILIVRIMAETASGFDLGWDPVLRFLQFQAVPVALLALGLGTPLVARDRSEDVLYLYAVRPVSPWHYAVGKMLAVAVPVLLLLLVPGLLIAVLRRGIMPDEVSIAETVLLVAKVALAAVFISLAYAGVSVGPSAATKQARWALLMALAFYVIPDAVAQIITRGNAYTLGPGRSAEVMLETLFNNREFDRGIAAGVVLILYGALGTVVTMLRVRKEMTP